MKSSAEAYELCRFKVAMAVLKWSYTGEMQAMALVRSSSKPGMSFNFIAYCAAYSSMLDLWSLKLGMSARLA